MSNSDTVGNLEVTMWSLIFVALSCSASITTARMAYVLPDGSETLLRSGQLTESFSCDGRPYGYYADVANNCQIFHICLPIQDNSGRLVQTAQFSFICGNGTIFSQDILTCQLETDAVPCEEAESLYEYSNSQFGSENSTFSRIAPDNADLRPMRNDGSRASGLSASLSFDPNSGFDANVQRQPVNSGTNFRARSLDDNNEVEDDDSRELVVSSDEDVNTDYVEEDYETANRFKTDAHQSV